MRLEFPGQIFEKFSNIKLYGNPSSGSRVVLCGQTDVKLIVSFRNFTIAPNLLKRGNIFNKNRHVIPPRDPRGLQYCSV